MLVINLSVGKSKIKEEKNDRTRSIEINWNGHSTCVFLHNLAGPDCTVRLNGKYDIVIPANTIGYTAIPGDYTRMEVITASGNISVYVVG